MTKFSLFTRITEVGTVTEPNGVPNPRYALPSTVNWMRALAILVTERTLDFKSARGVYSSISKKTWPAQEENSILEHLLFSLHQLSALRAMERVKPQADIARVGVVAWYYGIYWAAKAMIAAQTGAVQESHAATARAWNAHFPNRGLAIEPFNLHVTSLAKKDAEAELARIRSSRPRRGLVEAPSDAKEAYDANVAYLTGTVEWSQWKKQEELKETKEFKAIRVKGKPVSDFKSKAAQQLRDAQLRNASLSFVHQAFRYRGKANYREGLFLAHGKSVESTISNFTKDMSDVLQAFLAMAGAFASRRLDASLWSDFVADIERHRAFDVSPKEVWE